ncbi:MAG TPA: hypothetical protein VJ385_20980 [Fibrobacteria bacterium]|nr:hypothetical protein [Fibrobacteria bacterium]
MKRSRLHGPRLLLFAGLVSLPAAEALAQSDLFLPLPAAAASASKAAEPQRAMRKTLAAKPYVSRTQAALINGEALKQSSLFLNLFPDKKVKVLFHQVKQENQEAGESGGSREIRLGKAENSPGSDVTLFIRDGSVSGRIALDGRIYTINPAGEGVHVIAEIDPEKLPKED